MTELLSYDLFSSSEYGVSSVLRASAGWTYGNRIVMDNVKGVIWRV
jgi:hypothetical protein